MEPKISPTEATQALEAAEEATKQMRRAIGVGSSWIFLVIWGVIWTLGFLGNQFLPQSTASRTWTVLDVLGVLLSFGIGAYYGRYRIHSNAGIQMALYWFAWIVYGSLIVWAAKPSSPERLDLLILLFVMFAYVVLGIWLKSGFLGWLGVGGTIYALIGYHFFLPYFNLVMALAGLALVASGVYARLKWR